LDSKKTLNGLKGKKSKGQEGTGRGKEQGRAGKRRGEQGRSKERGRKTGTEETPYLGGKILLP
jgi:hypothetical protein